MKQSVIIIQRVMVGFVNGKMDNVKNNNVLIQKIKIPVFMKLTQMEEIVVVHGHLILQQAKDNVMDAM